MSELSLRNFINVSIVCFQDYVYTRDLVVAGCELLQENAVIDLHLNIFFATAPFTIVLPCFCSSFPLTS